MNAAKTARATPGVPVNARLKETVVRAPVGSAPFADHSGPRNIYEIAGVAWTVAPCVDVIEVPPAYPNQRFIATTADGSTVRFEVPWPRKLRPFSHRAIELCLAAALQPVLRHPARKRRGARAARVPDRSVPLTHSR